MVLFLYSGGWAIVVLIATIILCKIYSRMRKRWETRVVDTICTNDPSLIPELNEKCFVLKDFTEVLQMNDMDRLKEVYKEYYRGKSSD